MMDPNARASSQLYLIVAFLVLLGLSGCGGGSSDSSSSSFSGMNETYVVSSGNRRLQLDGITGHYSSVTFSGVNSVDVVLKPHTISLAGQSFPYLADENYFQGGGLVGYSSSSVADDPARASGIFNTLTGANFLGQLTISSNDSYQWCQHSSFNAGGCADGSAPISGPIVPIPGSGFKFSGIAGQYAIFAKHSAGAIFPVDNHGLNLKAVSQTMSAPKGTFSQCLITAKTKNHVAKVSFSGSKLTIEGIASYSGTYSYTFNAGAITFPSSACRNGTCTGIYNDKLGLVYLAQIGDTIFFKK